MATIDELRKTNAKLRQDLTGARSKLPKAQMPLGLPGATPAGWLTADEASAELGISHNEAVALLGERNLSKDNVGRLCISRAGLDHFLLLQRQDRRTERFI